MSVNHPGFLGPPGEPPSEPPPSKAKPMALGCGSYFALLGMIYLIARALIDQGGGNIFVFFLLGSPILGLFLAIIPRTRKFALGWIIGVVLSWLILAGACFYMLKYHFINN